MLIPVEVKSQTPEFRKSRTEQMEKEVAPRVGRTTTASLIQSNTLLFSSDIQTQVQKLLDELAEAANSKVKFRVHIINSPLVNMLAVPSGDIFVFTGFLDKIDNRDELAFGLGHEVAHIIENHGLRQMKHSIEASRKGSQAAFLFGTMVATAAGVAVSAPILAASSFGIYTPFYDMLVAATIGNFVARSAARIPIEIVEYMMALSIGNYSQEQELEADRLGMAYMTRAGYNPVAAVKVGEKLSEEWHSRQKNKE